MKTCKKFGSSDFYGDGRACKQCAIERSKIRYAAKPKHPRVFIPVKCSVDGCENQSRAFSFCTKHYQKFKKHGNPLLGKTLSPSGTGSINAGGYRVHGINGNTIYEHVAIAESALGKSLPVGAVVHHVDCNPLNNDPSNLVICPSQAYHLLLHTRQRALDACGNADFRKCLFCHQYDDVDKMQLTKTRAHFHKQCRADYERNRRRAKKMHAQ